MKNEMLRRFFRVATPIFAIAFMTACVQAQGPAPTHTPTAIVRSLEDLGLTEKKEATLNKGDLLALQNTFQITDALTQDDLNKRVQLLYKNPPPPGIVFRYTGNDGVDRTISLGRDGRSVYSSPIVPRESEMKADSSRFTYTTGKGAHVAIYCNTKANDVWKDSWNNPAQKPLIEGAVDNYLSAFPSQGAIKGIHFIFNCPGPVDLESFGGAVKKTLPSGDLGFFANTFGSMDKGKSALHVVFPVQELVKGAPNVGFSTTQLFLSAAVNEYGNFIAPQESDERVSATLGTLGAFDPKVMTTISGGADNSQALIRVFQNMTNAANGK